MQGTGKRCIEALGGTGPSGTAAGLVPIPEQPGGGSVGTQPSQESVCLSGRARVHRCTVEGDVGTATPPGTLPATGLAQGPTACTGRKAGWEPGPGGI